LKVGGYLSKEFMEKAQVTKERNKLLQGRVSKPKKEKLVISVAPKKKSTKSTLEKVTLILEKKDEGKDQPEKSQATDKDK